MRESMLADLESLAAGKGDVVGSASRWKEFGAGRALTWLQLAIGDLVKISVTESDKADLINADLVTRLRTVGKRIKLNDLFSFLDDISASCALLSGPLDEQLMLESILVRWARLAH